MQSWYFVNGAEVHSFEKNIVIQVMEPDINQELYGLPQYLGALHSAWLNESATLFRRKYYETSEEAHLYPNHRNFASVEGGGVS